METAKAIVAEGLLDKNWFWVWLGFVFGLVGYLVALNLR